MIVIDPIDIDARFPIAYSWQPVRGWAVKHYDIPGAQNYQRVKENALGEGPWDACEKLWTDAFEIPPEDFVFHPGTGNDATDALFPNEPPHPWTSYIHAKAMAGLSDSQTEKLFGIYRTLRTPNFDGNGNQLDSVGDVVFPSDPREVYFFKPNPANCSVDQLLRWGKRLNGIVNFPAWVDWRDWNDEFIDWDNSKYSPRNLSLTPTAGGTLIPGTTYISRVSTLRGADISSASKKSVEDFSNTIELAGGQSAFQVNWLIKGDEENPTTVPGDISGYRVYVGSIIGGIETWSGYFTVANPATRTLLVTTLAGVTVGVPPDLASAGLLVQIRRFECGLFVIPIYGLGTMLDRIMQISCADWQWSGLGTGTYRNDKIRFMSPANRAPVFTLNQAETGFGSFKTYAVDRRSRPNEILVNFRDRDDPFLGPDFVRLPREQLQEDEGQTKVFTIDGGTMYRSQAQRCASFYARVLCDMDQMAIMSASPKTYSFLPGDVFNITNETPDWVDEEFIIRRKEEQCEGGIGDQILLQIYTEDLYSDTDYSPLPSALPARRTNPFAVPPPIISLVLDEVGEISVQGLRQVFVQGSIQADEFHSPQVLRVWIEKPLIAGFEDTGIILRPDPLTLQTAFMYPSPEVGTYSFRVTVESELGVLAASSVTESVIVLGLPPNITDLTVLRVASDWFSTWDGSELFRPERYVVRIYIAGIGGALLRTHIVQLPDSIPVQWTYHSGDADQGLVNRDPDGSIYMTANFDPDEILQYLSQQFFGDVSFEFDVDDRVLPYQIGFFGKGIYIENGVTFDAAKYDWIRPEQADFLARRLNPRTSLRIDIKNGQAEYYIDGALWTRSFQGEATPIMQLNVLFADPASVPYPQAIFHCRVRPIQPHQFIYTEEMARHDNAGALPGTVRFEVTQISGADVEGNPVSVTA